MNLAPFIDHTVLKNTTTLADVQRVCAEALQYHFAAVCLPPYYVKEARQLLANDVVKLATVVGFPFGYHTTETKVAEAKNAIADGANELDVVINLAALKGGDWQVLEEEVAAISGVTSAVGATLKLIIESGILSDDEIISCCEVYQRYPVQFLKTSTGYADAGASVQAVSLMRSHLPATIQIKASGGIRDYAFAKELIEAGATRLGCSTGVAIVKGGL